MRHALLLLAFASAPALAQPLRASARFTVQDVSPADTAAILEGLREGLQSDSIVRLVWRPARGADATGQTLEVAPVMITILVLGDDTRRRYSFRAFDVRTNMIVGSFAASPVAGETPAAAATRAAREFVKSVKWPAK